MPPATAAGDLAGVTTPAPRPLALRASVGLAALLVALLALHPACTSADPAGGPDGGGSDAGDGGGGADGGDGGGASACKLDSDCGTARWCEVTSGTCRDAKPCPQGQGNCDYQAGLSDYCDGQACYCDPVDTSCKPLHLPCAACKKSEECGNDKRAYDHVADCLPAAAGYDTKASCIPRRDGYLGCPQGFTLPTDGGVYCSPGGGRCGAQGACGNDPSHPDKECDPHSATPICDTARKVCVAACTFDLKTGESLCPAGQVCHLIPGLKDLPPQDPNFGKGRCGPPCTPGATNCGVGLTCASSGLLAKVNRCRLPPPACMGDVECPDSPATHSNGYCDLVAHACRTDCRAKEDCKSGYVCAGAAGSKACVAETCLQAGGAATGCDYGQFCCGESGAPSCPSGTASGACFDHSAAWCGTCSADNDCRGAGYPSLSGSPNLCVEVAQNKKFCALGCKVGGPPGQCPRSWGCTKVLVGCDKASDCGNQAGARCDKPDGGSGTCGCASDAECPNKANGASDDTTCISGQCVLTQVCRPGCK